MKANEPALIASTLPASARTIAIACGLTAIVSSAAAFLERQGFQYDPAAPILVILDIPRGFAFHALETFRRADQGVIVATWSFCPEYNEDLWDLRIQGLIVGDGMTLELAIAIARVVNGGRYRLTPGAPTPLTPLERRMLRLLARGYPNQQIAQQISMQVQTVKNTLATIYRKLSLKNRSEALLYYWGIWHTLAQDSQSQIEHYLN